MTTRETLGALEVAAETCFLCRYCLEDLLLNGRFTDEHPRQGPVAFGPLFPREAKRQHLRLEGIA